MDDLMVFRHLIMEEEPLRRKPAGCYHPNVWAFAEFFYSLPYCLWILHWSVMVMALVTLAEHELTLNQIKVIICEGGWAVEFSADAHGPCWLCLLLSSCLLSLPLVSSFWLPEILPNNPILYRAWGGIWNGRLIPQKGWYLRAQPCTSLSTI